MFPILHAELLGALTGVCTVLVVLTGPDKPPPIRSADPVVSKAEQRAAKVATWAEFAKKKRRKPTKERP